MKLCKDISDYAVSFLTGEDVKNLRLINKGYKDLIKYIAESNLPALKYALQGALYENGIGVIKSYDKAIDLYKAGVDEDDTMSLCMLGLAYINAHGVYLYKQLGLEYLLRAEALGSIVASYYLGNYFYKSCRRDKADRKIAFDFIKNASDSGLAKANTMLGYLYETGYGTDTSIKEALRLYELGLDSGDAYGGYLLGRLYESGRYVLKSEAKAIEYYTKAYEMGLIEAAYSLASYYDRKKQGLKALELLSYAKDNGSDKAMYSLAEHYIYGDIVNQDLHEAFSLFNQAALRHNKEAIYQMGYCYLRGYGVEANKDLYLIYTKIAADYAIPNALRDYNELKKRYDFTSAAMKLKYDQERAYLKLAEGLVALGRRYLYGYNVDKDYDRAYSLFTEAYDNGSIEALGYLGYIYTYGLGAEKNEEVANRYFAEGDFQGDDYSSCCLGLSYLNGTGVDCDREKAASILKALAPRYPKAYTGLGYCYEMGYGVDKSIEEACACYTIAANENDPDAEYNLALIYKFGKLGFKDDRKADELFKRAAAHGSKEAQKYI